MFAFIDESGNTGPNLFDRSQPFFYSVAAIARADLDVVYAKDFARLAAEHGQPSLHANRLGGRALEKILPEIKKKVIWDNVHFFIGKIHKPFLVLTKLHDTLFDEAQNRAVPWHIHNIRPMRLMSLLKLSMATDEALLTLFWDAMMETNQIRAQNKFLQCLKSLAANLSRIPDERSRTLVGDATDWAIQHPEEISVFSDRSARLGHLPHLVIFPSLLDEVQAKSELWNAPVIEVRHDRESLVMAALENWHELLSNAPVGKFEWFGEQIPTGRVPGSKFKETNSLMSPGIQLADLVLWLTRRQNEKDDLGPVALQFMERIERNACPYELSMRATQIGVAEQMDSIMSLPLSDADLQRGKEVLAQIEAKRLERIREYDNANQ
ncbi:MAG TPA: DUF3800 domain-containing protein [Verrucomicrobiae bacterium]|jgi:hypothetical protein|nr:DUF3800 domain-containing protein [Verrucomicrobiae bacterium]